MGLAALALGPSAKAASIDISTTSSAPANGPRVVNAEIGREALVGVGLANVSGRALGWLDRPSRRSRVLVLWDGTLDGRPMRGGYYQVEVVVAGRVADAAGFRLDR